MLSKVLYLHEAMADFIDYSIGYVIEVIIYIIGIVFGTDSLVNRHDYSCFLLLAESSSNTLQYSINYKLHTFDLPLTYVKGHCRIKVDACTR